jgi:hypothetical protein
VATDNPKLLSDDAVEAAITRVLQAEVAARDAVVRARGEATQIAERAREQARGLGLHTDRRIRRVRAAFEATVTAEVAELDAEAEAFRATHDLTPAEIEKVEMAVAALAHGMTGGPT